MKNKGHHVRVIVLLLLTFLFAASSVTAQMASPKYQIRSAVLTNGGGQNSSAHFGVQNSTGQSVPVGISISHNYGLYAGLQPMTLSAFPEWVPSIWVSQDHLDFGIVMIERSSDLSLTINNDGFGKIKVTDISMDSPMFSCDTESLIVWGLSSAEIVVTFAPTIEDTFEAVLTLLCNDPEQPKLQINLYGVGVADCRGEIGDVNGDASINVLDVVAAINHILGLVILDEFGQCRADCNGDGSLNVLDALHIVNVILGIIPECPEGDACKLVITSETIEFLKALETYFPAEEFARFMTMVKEVQVPAEYSLTQNYPNPFNQTTDIQYQIPDGRSPASTILKIYNILGQEVRTLVDEVQEAGYYTVAWDRRNRDGRPVSSGIYFYRITAGEFTATKRMILMK